MLGLRMGFQSAEPRTTPIRLRNDTARCEFDSPFRGSGVTRVEQYEKQAADCVRLAQEVSSERAKVLLLEMAQAWVHLAEHARRREPQTAVNDKIT
jgi:hypothetical protein